MENLFDSIIQNVAFWVIFCSVISFGYKVSKSKKEVFFLTNFDLRGKIRYIN